MKKAKKIVLITIGVCLLLEAALKIYVAFEEHKRTLAPGNDVQYNVEALTPHEQSSLSGKKILFLGSSVTYGAAAEGQSFVELFETLDGVKAVKEAKSGTTLVDKTSILALLAFGNGDSYIKRLKQIDTNMKLDCVFCQLSTNDATMNLPLGDISKDKDLSSFDTKTVTGAMEYIIKYSQDTWNCPIVFYTGSYYESEAYEAMVKRLYELSEKWDIEIIDLYTDKEFNDIDKKSYDLYMFDTIHPTKAGYIEWWMPKMEEELIRIMSEK